MRKLTFLSVTFFSLFLLSACASVGKGMEINQETAFEQEPKEIEGSQDKEQQQTDDNIYPLTGQAMEEVSQHRVIGVMINNHTKARPQSGLSQADIVYEVLAEGQITRFLALFHSRIPDTIGPVRSARPYYFEIASAFNSVYLYHGASTAINRKIAANGIHYLDGSLYDNNGWLFQRSSERSAPHNSYLITAGLDQALTNKDYPQDHEVAPLPFSKEKPIDGTDANGVTITYSEHPEEVVTFTYDEASGRYLRSSDGEPSFDAANEERLAVDNVMIVETEHQIIDSKGRRDIDLTSGGKGYLIQKGKVKEIEWKNIDGRILPYDNEEPLSFVPGQTWVNIVPKNAAVTVND
ncbi:DUF3048 domain-containing protein [Halobacillus mangrovi]|uniref:Lipoprotein YerB n=1 Tax=Halobacillus mangrovi TaxID=402384 RepID=A0A1W5ZZ73_9BACI|nr:DUF3048 domain-containing protein [Halobacillus mangrovi]ARI78582.1 hypothetical protein HM131_17825 [Halobacillus mangrovi]